MKRVSRFLKFAVASLLVVLALSFAVQAKAAVRADLKNYSVYSRTSMTKLAKKLGLRKSPAKYYSWCYRGKARQVTIAMNSFSVSYPKKYVYINNKGSKRLLICGVKMGDPISVVKTKMRRAGYSGNGKTFGVFYDGFTMKYNSRGRLKEWTYRLYPTS